jgi:hypothetical protein
MNFSHSLAAMHRLLANHVIETMCSRAHLKIVLAVIEMIMIRRGIQIIGNLDFQQVVILATSLQIQIGIARI